MEELNLIFFIILSLAIGEISIQIVISELANKIKGLMFLNQPYSRKLSLMSSILFWRKLSKYGWFLFLPVVLVLKLHKLMSEILQCPWCLSYHISWLTSYLYLHTDIITAVLLSPISLVFVTILDLLHTHE